MGANNYALRLKRGLMRNRLAIADNNRRWFIISIGSLLFLLSMFHRVSNAVIAPLLIDELHLSPDELGLLAAVFFWAFALFQIPLGFLLDRFGTRIIMTILSIAGGTGSIIFAQSDGVNGLLVGRILLGLGMSCNFMGNLRMLVDWFPADRFATLSGLLVAIGTLGSVIATSPLVLMVNAIGWRGSFFLIGLINILVGLAFFVIARDRPYSGDFKKYPQREIKADTPLVNGFRKLFLDCNFWFISWGAFIRYGTYGAIQALWAGPFLMRVIHLSHLVAGNLILIFNIGLILGSPLFGFLSDRILRSRKKAVIMGLILLGLTEFTMAFSRSTNVLLWGAVFLLMGCGSSTMQIMFSHIKELMPKEMAGRSMTAINFFNMLGPAVFLYAFGKVLSYLGTSASDEGYKMAFLMCSFGVSLAILLYSRTKDVIVKRY